MKKYLLIWLFGPMLMGCTYTAKMDKLTEENKKLESEVKSKDAAINYFSKSFDDIENNLAAIKERESLISVDMRSDKPELRSTAKDRIVDDIKYIDGLMASNHNIITSLQEKLNKSNTKLREFSKMVQTLSTKVEQKDKDYALLREELSKSSLSIKDLKNRNSDLESN